MTKHLWTRWTLLLAAALLIISVYAYTAFTASASEVQTAGQSSELGIQTLSPRGEAGGQAFHASFGSASVSGGAAAGPVFSNHVILVSPGIIPAAGASSVRHYFHANLTFRRVIGSACARHTPTGVVGYTPNYSPASSCAPLLLNHSYDPNPGDSCAVNGGGAWTDITTAGNSTGGTYHSQCWITYQNWTPPVLDYDLECDMDSGYCSVSPFLTVSQMGSWGPTILEWTTASVYAAKAYEPMSGWIAASPVSVASSTSSNISWDAQNTNSCRVEKKEGATVIDANWQTGTSDSYVSTGPLTTDTTFDLYCLDLASVEGLLDTITVQVTEFVFDIEPLPNIIVNDGETAIIPLIATRRAGAVSSADELITFRHIVKPAGWADPVYPSGATCTMEVATGTCTVNMEITPPVGFSDTVAWVMDADSASGVDAINERFDVTTLEGFAFEIAEIPNIVTTVGVPTTITLQAQRTSGTEDPNVTFRSALGLPSGWTATFPGTDSCTMSGGVCTVDLLVTPGNTNGGDSVPFNIDADVTIAALNIDAPNEFFDVIANHPAPILWLRACSYGSDHSSGRTYGRNAGRPCAYESETLFVGVISSDIRDGDSGSPVQLIWRSNNTANCAATGGWPQSGLESDGVNSSVPGVPTVGADPVVYTITCIGDDGSVISKFITVSNPSGGGDTPNIDVDGRPIVRSGDPITITWDLMGNTTDSCTVTAPEEVAIQEALDTGDTEYKVNPTTISTYTLECNGASDSVTVQVTPNFDSN
jgi:hypothetical protein